MSVTTSQFVALGAIILFAAIVQSISGFGFSLMSVPLMVLVIDLHLAVVVATLIGTISSTSQAWLLRSDRDDVLTKRFIASTCVGAPFGLLAFIFVPQNPLKVLLGVGVLFGVVVLARGVDMRATHHSFDWIMGALSGVLLMATSTNGPPLVFTLQARHVEAKTFRATLNTVFAFSGYLAIVLYTISGKISAQSLLLAAGVAPLLLSGLAIGTRVRAHIEPNRFRILVLVLLTVSGASSIFSALR